MKTIRICAVIVLSFIAVGAKAQSFNVERKTEEQSPNVMKMPNIAVLSFDGQEVEFTTACGFKHIVVCHIGVLKSPLLGNAIADFTIGTPFSYIMWDPLLTVTKGMTKSLIASSKKMLCKSQSKSGITSYIDLKKNMIDVWGLPNKQGVVYVLALGAEGELLYSAAASDADSLTQALSEATKFCLTD